MERQYIGARYVPIFFENPNTGDATWLAGVAYEPLTIVTFAGNSYTSKKPVPAGTGAPNSNPEFWVATGLFNAQVEELREEITTAQEDVTELQNKFPIKPDSIAPKQYILLADSFGNGTTVGGDTWIQWFEDMTGTEEGVSAFSSYSSSGGFVKPGVNGTYLAQLTSITTSGVITNPKNITDIVIQTAGNDWDSESTLIQSALETFMTYVKTNYPNATVHIAITSKFNTNIISASIGVKYTVMPTIKNCVYLGYHYITNSEYIMQTLSTTDGVHPNEQNSKLLAGYLHSGVMGGSVSVQMRVRANFTPNHTGGDTVQLTLEMNNNVTTVFQTGSVASAPLKFTLFNSTASPLTGWSWFNGIVFGSVPASFIRPLADQSYSTFIQLTTTDKGIITAPVTISTKYNETTDTTDFLLTSGKFTTDSVSPTITKIEMPKFTIMGVTEWII